MREWLSGGAPPCQGGGRGFDPRLALFYFLRGSQYMLTSSFFVLNLFQDIIRAAKHT